MDYAKHLLHKEKVKLGKFDTMSQLFEMLSNQQEIKNVGKKAMSLISKVKGDVALLQFDHDAFHLIHFFGNRESIETRLHNRPLMKTLQESRKPLFGTISDGYYMMFPIFSKEDYLGALCVFDEQEIKHWEEIYTLLHMMSFIFKYYSLIEENKSNSVKDSVTGLNNYRHFQSQLQLELLKATRAHSNLSIVTFNIENFRLFNERLGYDAGDEVLRQMGKIIARTCRKIDMPVRLKDDTFSILLTNTDLLGAFILMNRTLLSVKRHVFKIKDKEFKIRVKSSATLFELHDVQGKELLERSISSLKVFTSEEIMHHIKELEDQKK